MEKLIVLPVIILVLSGLALELSAIADKTADRTIEFANDVNGALDCAFSGVPITFCSPNLTSDYGFRDQLKNLTNITGMYQGDGIRTGTSLRVKPGDAFLLSFNEKSVVVKFDGFVSGVARLSLVKLDDGANPWFVDVADGSVYDLDIDGDTYPDAKISIEGRIGEDVAMWISSAEGSVAPLDFSLISLFSIMLIFSFKLLKKQS